MSGMCSNEVADVENIRGINEYIWNLTSPERSEHACPPTVSTQPEVWEDLQRRAYLSFISEMSGFHDVQIKLRAFNHLFLVFFFIEQQKIC